MARKDAHDFREPAVLAHAPAELTNGRLRRLGEGIGKVVYASEHWVVKRERSRDEILALIAIWKALRKFEHLLPRGVGDRWLEHPSHQLRLLRVFTQRVLPFVPRSVWFMRHMGEVLHTYTSRNERGENLAERHLHGTSLVPRRITFPPVRVKVGGWPGWLAVSEATERVECTLFERIEELARHGRFGEVEVWLDRFLELRQEGWKRGIFSVDAHLKNFGVNGDRVVLLDPGGLTDHWEEIEDRLAFEEGVPRPHVRLGLGRVLEPRGDIADRFDENWRSVVNRDRVRGHWPE
jgi:hypothetical protein